MLILYSMLSVSVLYIKADLCGKRSCCA